MYMSSKNLLWMAVTVLSAWACTNEMGAALEPEAHGEDVVAPGKIANRPTEATEGVLVVQFDEQSVATIEAQTKQATRGGSPMTRSGIVSVDEALETLGVTSMERVFPADKEEKELRAAGMHRWYVLKFDPSHNLETAAETLARYAEVSTVQYSMKLARAHFDKGYPLSKALPQESRPATRALQPYPFDDPNLFWQWHYINNVDQAVSDKSRAGADINVGEVWKLTGGDPRIIVAIVDDGVKYTHPDLAANMWTNPNPDPDRGNQDIHGYNFLDEKPISWCGEEGDEGHGTHVAGTVAAVNNNGVGVCGIAGGTGHGDGVKLMSCQIFSGKRSASDYQSARAIQYAADHGASILQCSYSYRSEVQLRSDTEFENYSPLLFKALDYFAKKKNCDAIDGGLIFYAAGNESESTCHYPGAYRNYVSVTAFSVDKLPAYYTNYGRGCNISAPGGEIVGSERAGILSTLCSEISDDDYGYMQGTSMACPHVSGVAALGLSYALKLGKHFTREEFTNMLLTSVGDIDGLLEGYKNPGTGNYMDLSAYRGNMGTGTLDAYRLMMQIEGTPCLVIPVGIPQEVILTTYFGGGAEHLTYLDVTISEADRAKLGIKEEPKFVDGKLRIACTSPGVAKITVRAVAGGNRPASGTVIGGMEISKTFAIIVCSTATNGGWL